MFGLAAESMIRKRPKTQAAAGVANKPPQTPVSQENGEQFGEPFAENARNPRVDVVADERVSSHDGIGTGELFAPGQKKPGDDRT